MSNNYTDKHIRKLSPMQAIQMRTTHYIPKLGTEGVVHLTKELIQNSIDEMTVSECDRITVMLDVETQKITVIDNGRGIPPNSIHDIVTELHSGGKMDNKAYKKNTAGLNGLGTAAVNALSEEMTITVKRNGKIYQTSYSHGEKVKDLEVIGECKKEETGTNVVFRAAEEYLEDYNVHYDDLYELCKNMSYLIPRGNVIKYVCDKDDNTNPVVREFKHDNGIESLLNDIVEDGLLDNIRFKDSRKMKNDKGETFYRELDIVFNIDMEDPETNIISYANYCTTYYGGTHVDGFKYEIGRVLINEVKKNMSKKHLKKYKPVPDDVRVGLKAVINASIEDAQFEGQGKRKISNNSLYDYVREITEKGIIDWIAKNKSQYKKLEKVIIANAKARKRDLALRKLAIADNKGKSNFFSGKLDEKFKAAEGSSDLELFLVEGKSAMGSAKNSRDVYKQAFYAFRGYPLNTYGKNIVSVLKNTEFKSLVEILGAGIGNNFDIEKLKYERIIIMTDADVDGHKIFSLLCTFFLCHMPELVKRGMLYKAVSPLYKFKLDGKETFVKNRREYYNIIEELISEQNEIMYNGKELEDEELVNLLSKNRNYLEIVDRASTSTGVHPVLLEYLCKFKDLKIEQLVDKLSTRFEDVKHGKVSGYEYVSAICDGQFNTVLLSPRIYKRIEVMNIEIKDKNANKILYKLNGVEMSLFEMLSELKDYEPKNMTRYKGLGEMNPEQLKETTLDPKNRTLVQLTIEDMEECIEAVRKLHGSKAKERRDLMESHEINLLDIDN